MERTVVTLSPRYIGVGDMVQQEKLFGNFRIPLIFRGSGEDQLGSVEGVTRRLPGRTLSRVLSIL